LHTFWDNIIKIPQNNNHFIEIKKSENWSYCIDVIINKELNINFLNLYLTLKSLSENQIYYCFKIALVVQKKDKTLVTENMRSHKFIMMNLEEFENWINFRITHDWKYINNEDFYCIRLVYNAQIIEKFNLECGKNILNYLKPNYPWKKEILKIYDKPYKSNITQLKLKIHRLRKIIRKIKIHKK